MSAKKFFEDNINRIPQSDPVTSNLNKGLLALAKEQESMTVELKHLRQDLATIARALQQLQHR